MKESKILWVLLAVVVMLVAWAMTDKAEPADKEVKMAEFKTVFTITYNSLTLEQAAALEKVVRQQHEKACGVTVSLESLGIIGVDYSRFYIQNGIIGTLNSIPVGTDTIHTTTIKTF